MTEREIFVEAFQEPDLIARRAFLDRACEGDTALRARVEALLKKAAEAGRFLEDPPAGPRPDR
jgi:serine/threonine-protein kinase